MDFFLEHCRVLDLTDEMGQFCGKLLGDLGADVVKVERPGGDPSRAIGPFYHDIPSPEKSLHWFAYNTSKRSITLNLETADGREIFRKLAAKADIIIESFMPGYLSRLDLDYEKLSATNPRLILTSITPFGRSGPYSEFKASDLICMAMGGQMTICGDADRAPLRFSAEQSYPLGGGWAAVATLIAYYHREITGIGQHIDVSLQECVLQTDMNMQHFWYVDHFLFKRQGIRIVRGNKIAIQNMWPCKDGYISWRLFTAGFAPWTENLVEWMVEEGMAEHLAEIRWKDINFELLTQDEVEYYERPFGKFFLSHTKKELFEESIKRGFSLFPVSTVKDLFEAAQLQERGFWVQIEHPELGASLSYAGPPFKADKALCEISRRPPLIGEHNEEIYVGELGMTLKELLLLKQANVI